MGNGDQILDFTGLISPVTDNKFGIACVKLTSKEEVMIDTYVPENK